MSFTDILFAQSLGSGGGGVSSLSELDDVNITSPSDGQAITYDETSGKWINDSISAGTDENVKQSPTTTDADYEILLSGSADNTEHTEGVKKTSTLRYNPDDESILVGDTTIPSGSSASHRYSSVTNNDITVINNYTTNLGANKSQTMQILPTDIVVQGDSEISGSWIGGENSLRDALIYAATHGGGDIEIVEATPIQDDDDHVTLSVTRNQINTYLSEDKIVFVDYVDSHSNKQRYSLIRYDGSSWGFIFLRNNWNEVTNEPYLECGRIVSGNNNDPYVADYSYVTYPLDSGYTDVTGTLTAGSTSITLSNAAITTSSTLDYYTDTFGVNPTNVSVSTGSVTLTFEAQSSDLGVKVRVG